MQPSNTFLTAEWKNIVMLNYPVDPRLLNPFVPSGTELDFFEGKTYVSLIGFEFQKTRLRGIPVPFHQSFEELNLRFYVSYSGKRGAVFIRELVPKRAVALVARLMFHENYSYSPMSHRLVRNETGEVTNAAYCWSWAGESYRLEIEPRQESYLPANGSLSQFITEHYWGYAAQPDGGCLEYAVEHPAWRVSDAERTRFTGDAAALYGVEMGRALEQAPESAFFVEGSAVIVSRGRRIS